MRTCNFLRMCLLSHLVYSVFFLYSVCSMLQSDTNFLHRNIVMNDVLSRNIMCNTQAVHRIPDSQVCD
jgi:hypothetical protein